VVSERSRRNFLKVTMTGAALGAAAMSREAAAGQSSGTLSLEKGLVYSMLPRAASVADRFKLVRDAGFQLVQVPTTPDLREAEETKKAAETAGIRIDSTMDPALWKFPLSSASSAVASKGLESMRTTLHNAKLWGSEVMLLVPAAVNPQTGYRAAWVRSQQQIRKLLPLT
jgi:L-ribulose-5-phosphate 3-epimerase